MLKSTAHLLLSIIILIGVESCANRPVFPDQTTIPRGRQLPMDGIWRLTTGNTRLIFRVDKGRMFFYEVRDPLPKSNNLLSMGAIAKNPRIPSAADLSRREGGIIAKDITETNDPLTYTCQSFSFDTQSHIFEFGPGEIKIVSSTQINLKTFPNSKTGFGETIEESFWRENLDNQTWFEQTILKMDDHGSIENKGAEAKPKQLSQDFQLKQEQPSQDSKNKTAQISQDSEVKQEQPSLDSQTKPQQPNQDFKTKTGNSAQSSENSEFIEREPVDNSGQNREVINVPMDKMETNGELSNSARDFVAKAVKNAKKANGYVEINCPPNAPRSVIRSLVILGVDTYVDYHLTDYELVIAKP